MIKTLSKTAHSERYLEHLLVMPVARQFRNLKVHSHKIKSKKPLKCAEAVLYLVQSKSLNWVNSLAILIFKFVL